MIGFGRDRSGASATGAGVAGALPERVSARLLDEFRGRFGEAVIARYVRESLLALTQTADTDFLPMLVYRFTRERLRGLASAGSELKLGNDSDGLP
jgi:hypothetical protein